MKISKLFHSLYALLMLAPVFAVGGAMAFNIINDKAVDNAHNQQFVYQQAVPQYHSNNVDDISDLVAGNIYQLSLSDLPNGDICSTDFVIYVRLYSTTYTQYYYFDYPVLLRNNNGSISCYYSGNVLQQISISSTTGFYFVYLSNFNSNFISHVSICPSEVIPITAEEASTTYPDNLSDNFYYALDNMNNSDVFSWAKTSFLAEPFSYIFGLFGIPSGSPFITLLSYWLSISIIWLVFDLVMYVPLLVHGWIDKGGIE